VNRVTSARESHVILKTGKNPVFVMKNQYTSIRSRGVYV
jgi:hypothetical protein